ncbi:MAG: Uma2 family endonuclease [Acidimicrobiales bacterium]
MAAVTHVGPWTEADLAGLPEDGQRYELVEGALLLNPPPTPRHQIASLWLAQTLQAGAPAGLVVVEAVGVRIPEGSVLVPDVLLAEREAAVENRSGVLDASVVHLVAEIVSPGSTSMDRLAKPALYARARIPSYWRVELDEGPALHAFRLDAGTYEHVGTALPGKPISVGVPFTVTIDPAALV